MNIRRRGRGKRLIAALIAFVFTASLVLGGIFFLHSGFDGFVNEKSAAAPKPPLFSFTTIPGWWRGATNETSLSLFDNNECLVSAKYIVGTVDVAADLQHIHNQLARNGNHAMTVLATKKLTLQTTGDPQPYELHQFSITSPQNAQKVKGGQEIGYVQLADGYVLLSGYCDSPSQLEATIPALLAIHITKHH